MSFSFTKMQALGNDFVVLDTLHQPIAVNAELIRTLADRHTGVGCDQVLVLTQTHHSDADFGYRIFNADGNEVFQCGNGARCMGLYVFEKNLTQKKKIVLETKRGLISVHQHDGFTADIAIPDFNPESLPFITNQSHVPFQLQLQNHAITFDVVSVGNPHCVIHDIGYSQADKISIGEQCNNHPAFPHGVNVGFVQTHTSSALTLSVYERGVGLTNACGSGACAAVAIERKNKHVEKVVTVTQPGGNVVVIFDSLDDVIQLNGPAAIVFEGRWP